MPRTAQSLSVEEGDRPRPNLTNLRTTLYELIEAIGEEVQPGEDQLVAKIVLDLLRTRHIRSLGSLGENVH